MKIDKVVVTVGVALRSLVVGGNLISLSLVTEPRKMISYISECLFLYKTLNSKRRIQQKNVFEVLPVNKIETIKLGNLSGGQHWFKSISSYALDILSLCLICQAIKPRVVFEIGTLRGYTAFHFALNTPNDARIYTLDLPKQLNANPRLKTTVIDDGHIKRYMVSNGYCFEDSDVAPKITSLFGDSAVFDFSPFYGEVDFFFIDGAHSYDYVRSDTLNALKCCHTRSVIAWHDFGRVGVNGVTKWLLELSREHEIYSIPGGSVAYMVVKSQCL